MLPLVPVDLRSYGGDANMTANDYTRRLGTIETFVNTSLLRCVPVQAAYANYGTGVSDTVVDTAHKHVKQGDNSTVLVNK
jgi:hypothetical protein